MTIEQINSLIKSESYDFLRTNPHLANRIIFLALGGSHAYGTNVETSDVDIRGCALNSAKDLIGFSNFEQVVVTAMELNILSIFRNKKYWARNIGLAEFPMKNFTSVGTN